MKSYFFMFKTASMKFYFNFGTIEKSHCLSKTIIRGCRKLNAF